MATTRELRRRIRSVRTTRQITRAMELVASSKLRGAIKAASVSQQYVDGLYQVLSLVLGQGENLPDPLTSSSSGPDNLVIALSSDQGLAGLFHSNNLKACLAFPPSTKFYVLGNRLAGSLRRAHRTVLTESHSLTRSLQTSELDAVTTDLIQLFQSGKYHSVHVIFTHYQSAMLQKVTSQPLLPFQAMKHAQATALIEPEINTVLPLLLKQTLKAILVAAARQTRASEFAIRRTSMHAATENAGDLIERYTLAYNRARQAAITTEIAEIVGGAAALTH